jgi:DNA repair exonuclease SbcCD ATPase subunit
MDGDIT